MTILSYDDITPDTYTACSKCLQPCDVIVEHDEDRAHRPCHDVMSSCCEADIITEEEAERILESLEPDIIRMSQEYGRMVAA